MAVFTVERLDYEEDPTGIVLSTDVVEITTGERGQDGSPGPAGPPGPNLVTAVTVTSGIDFGLLGTTGNRVIGVATIAGLEVGIDIGAGTLTLGLANGIARDLINLGYPPADDEDYSLSASNQVLDWRVATKFALSGLIPNPTGDYLLGCSLFRPVSLTKFRAKTATGTLTVSVLLNGSPVAGWGGLPITDMEADFVPVDGEVSCNAGDQLSLSFSAVAGTGFTFGLTE